MKHFLIKFNHGVEIGAFYAYLGHYKRTKDLQLLNIINDERVHKETLKLILETENDYPSVFIDVPFYLVGNVIGFLCKVAPVSWLDFIASTMEIFAVFSYNKLAIKYPKYKDIFTMMSQVEDKHKLYFK